MEKLFLEIGKKHIQYVIARERAERFTLDGMTSEAVKYSRHADELLAEFNTLEKMFFDTGIHSNFENSE
ncbi:hypothetical protein FACS1894111_10320 [Clostridia bacterium]|nr:hypothetical protein FACS1894111_10320 [Clostridia bacterium]